MTADELTRLGFAPTLRGLVLLPTSGCTAAQLERVFAGDKRALQDVLRACQNNVCSPGDPGLAKQETDHVRVTD